MEMILGDALDAGLVEYRTAGLNNVVKSMMIFSTVTHLFYTSLGAPPHVLAHSA